MRPAISSSSSTMRTTVGDDCAMRTKSSICTGAGPSSATMRALVVGRIAVVLRDGALRLARQQLVLFHDRRQYGSNVGGFSHGCCALLDQAVGSFRSRVERRSRHGEDFAALFERAARGNERA